MKYKRLLSVFILLLVINFLPSFAIWIPRSTVLNFNPLYKPIWQIIVLLVSLPFIITWFRWLYRNWFSDHDKEPVILFALAGLCWVISYFKYGNGELDFHFHDTYYIITTMSFVLSILGVFCTFCLVYYTWPVILKRHLKIKLSRTHFWITYIGLDLLTGKRNTEDIPFAPRRYIEYQGWASFTLIQNIEKLVLTIFILIVIAQFLFMFNITYSLFNKANK